MRYTVNPPVGLDGAAYQSWLRRRIGNLRRLQVQRIAIGERQKKEIDTAIERADREIANLEAQVTIGAVK